MTTLSQDGRTLSLEQDNDGYLDSLAQKLDQNMSMAISTYRLRRQDNLSDFTCTSRGSRETTMTTIGNFRWSINQAAQQVTDDTESQSITPTPTPTPAPEPEPEPTPEPVPNGQVMQGGSAPSLTSGDCEEDCTECASFYYENRPNEPWYECVDKTVYVYNLQCTGSKDMSKCATESKDYCFQSYTFPR